MSDAFDVHSDAAVTYGLTAALKAMSDTLGIEVNSVDRSFEPEATEEAQNRDGEVFALAVQKRDRWKKSYDCSGIVTDEATFLGLSEIEVAGDSFKVISAKITGKVRGWLEGSMTLVSFKNVP